MLTAVQCVDVTPYCTKDMQPGEIPSVVAMSWGATGITDLHRNKIDHITIPSKQGKGQLKRVEEVFDCWFESGR